ncbi:hypothetical protein R6Q57_016439 [Mikania cordata]
MKDMYKNTLSELISIINSYDLDDKQRALNHAGSMGITPASENAALLSAINYQASGPQHHQASASQPVPFETAFLSFGKANRRFEFTTGSSKLVPLSADPVMTDLNNSDDSEVCAENLSVSGRREKEEERSASRSTYCSTSSSKSHFVLKVDFVGRFETIKIKKNEMFKDFKTKFVKINDDIKNK